MLKLYFGADRRTLAEVQLEALREVLEQYEALQAIDPGSEPRGPWLTLECGLAHVRASIRFWESVLERR